MKANQKTLYRQIGAQFQGRLHIPFPATDQEKRDGLHTTWDLSAKEAPEHIKANWPGSAWIVEVVTTTRTRKGMRKAARLPSVHHQHPDNPRSLAAPDPAALEH